MIVSRLAGTYRRATFKKEPKMSTQLSENQMETVASPMPTPDDFPVTWEDPADAGLFWLQQRMHFPEPMLPLDEWFLRSEFEGATRAAQVYDLPIFGKGRRFNTYAYAAIAPLPLSPEEFAERQGPSQEKLTTAMGSLAQTWQEQHLPEIQHYVDAWAAFDLKAASTAELIAHLNESIAWRDRLWDIHFLVWFPAYTAVSLFEDLYCDLFGAEKIFEAYQLLQGFHSTAIETFHALWQLSRQISSTPQVKQIFEDLSIDEIPAALEGSAQGRAFLAELRAFLQAYGQRSDKWVFSDPSWIEDPSPPIKNLKDYMAQPDRDPMAEMADLAAGREERLALIRAELRDHPQPVVDHFEFILKAAQEGSVLTEDHDFWINGLALYPVRRLLLEFGHRFAEAGALAQRDDIFYLTLDEIAATALALPKIDRRSLIAGRQAEIAYFRGIQPPPALGTPPEGPPADDPVSRAIGKFFGAPPQPSADPNLLFGNAGSPGTARGPARVITSLSESARLQPGDVLVATTTAPPWTPLFATAVAVVTDTGGILSHCAVVAREYGIPAVVGTGIATSVFQDGQMVEVEGHTGTVRIVETGF
jgi:phosphohistidine swiveling domain-containing protein